MSAQATLPVHFLLFVIAEKAGAKPDAFYYANGILFVPDIEQAALDNAILNYNHDAEVAAFNKAREGVKPLNTPLYNVTFDLYNRLQVLEGKTPVTKKDFVALADALIKSDTAADATTAAVAIP